MNKLALIKIKDNSIVEIFDSAKGRISLPGVGEVSPPLKDWEGHGYKIIAVTPAPVLAGKKYVGDWVYTVNNNTVTESAETVSLPDTNQKSIPELLQELISRVEALEMQKVNL